MIIKTPERRHSITPENVTGFKGVLNDVVLVLLFLLTLSIWVARQSSSNLHLMFGKQLNFTKKKKKKNTGPIQMFSCEFCVIFKNTFFYRTPPCDCCCRSGVISFHIGAWSFTGNSYQYMVIDAKI